MDRRTFLRDGTLVLGAIGVGAQLPSRAWAADFAADGTSDPKSDDSPVLRIGLVTDLHYADKPATGSRHHRRAIERLEKAVAAFNGETKDKAAPAAGGTKSAEAHQPVDLIIELGDLIDSAKTNDAEIAAIKRMTKVFAAAKAPRHYVLGNHCVEELTKEQFLDAVEQKKSYYSFDAKGLHIVILDACFRKDGVAYGNKNSSWDDANLPPAELEWLTADLAATKLPVILFVHQRLDVATKYAARNAADARKILEASKRTLAVFHGHEHKNDHTTAAGIHYTTMAALVEGGAADSNAYSIIDVFQDGKLAVHGFAKQKSYDWRA
jgi:alkaline phosphatase